MAEFAYNNKVHTGTKVLPFKANQGQDPRIGFKMRKEGKYEGAEKFTEKMRNVQKETKAPHFAMLLHFLPHFSQWCCLL